MPEAGRVIRFIALPWRQSGVLRVRDVLRLNHVFHLGLDGKKLKLKTWERCQEDGTQYNIVDEVCGITTEMVHPRYLYIA